MGGLIGAALGAVLTFGYAQYKEWTAVVPRQAFGLGLAAALVIGAIPGLYPAIRASRQPPTEALRSA